MKSMLCLCFCVMCALSLLLVTACTPIPPINIFGSTQIPPTSTPTPTAQPTSTPLPTPTVALPSLTPEENVMPSRLPGPTLYEVQLGDTLADICARHLCSWHDIASINGIEAPYNIYPGQVIVVIPQTTGGDSPENYLENHPADVVLREAVALALTLSDYEEHAISTNDLQPLRELYTPDTFEARSPFIEEVISWELDSVAVFEPELLSAWRADDWMVVVTSELWLFSDDSSHDPVDPQMLFGLVRYIRVSHILQVNDKLEVYYIWITEQD